MRKEYKQYKKTDTEWIERLPEGWKVVALKWIAHIYAGGTPNTSIEEYWQGGTIPWLNSGAINQKKIKSASSLITEKALQNSSAKWVPRGALLMALAGQGKTKGTVAILEIEATCNQSMAAIVPDKEKIESTYLYYWLDCNYERIRGLAGDEQRDGLNLDILGSICSPLPCFCEQIQIARFLDYQTALIDTIIAKKQKLIELLKEKRQSVINEAVTKGLNPDASMKDSGVEWLGAVPAHWTIVKLRYLSEITTGEKDTENREDDGEYPFFVRSQTVERISSYSFDGEAILTAGDGVGVCKVWHYIDGKFDFHQRVYMLSNFSRVLGKYLFYYIRENFINDVLKLSAKSTVDSLRRPMFLDFKVLFPEDIEEQKAIISFIENYEKLVEETILKEETVIEKLKEYRQSLISEAVTGKIDVRDWEPPAA